MWDFHRKLEGPKTESDCKTLDDLKEFKEKKEKEAKLIAQQIQFSESKSTLKRAFKQAQKTIGFEDGLNMRHYIKIADGVLNTS